MVHTWSSAVIANFKAKTKAPGWAGADAAFWPRKDEIKNRADDMALGFLYRPHKDHPEIAPEVRACFVGVEVTDINSVPAGMSTTRFSGGEYVVVACQGDSAAEAADGVGAAFGQLMEWIPAHSYSEGNACFAAGSESAPKPPYIEYVYIKLES